MYAHYLFDEQESIEDVWKYSHSFHSKLTFLSSKIGNRRTSVLNKIVVDYILNDSVTAMQLNCSKGLQLKFPIGNQVKVHTKEAEQQLSLHES